MKFLSSSILFATILATSLLHSARAGECSLCGDDQTIHDDNQQMLLYISESETYTSCTDLAMALLETSDSSFKCEAIQSQFASNCCTEHHSTTTSRSLWNSANTASWTKPVNTNIAPASTSWGKAPVSWASSPSSSSWAKPISTTTPFKPTASSAWWTNKPKPVATTPAYTVPSLPPPKPIVYSNPNVVLSNHPAWGQNNGSGNSGSKGPGTNYLNDGYCGICTDPANGSLGIVVNSFAASNFAYTGSCRDLNNAFRAQKIKSNHQMCNVTLARFRGDCGCGGFSNNAQNFFGKAPQSNTGGWCIKGHTC